MVERSEEKSQNVFFFKNTSSSTYLDPKYCIFLIVNKIGPVGFALTSNLHNNNLDIRMDIFKTTFLGITDFKTDISVEIAINIVSQPLYFLHGKAEKGRKAEEGKSVSFIGYAGSCAIVLRTTVSNFSSDKGGVKNRTAEKFVRRK